MRTGILPLGLVVLFVSLACSAKTQPAAEAIPASAMTTPTAFTSSDLRQLRFVNTGLVFEGETNFKSIVRPGLTIVLVQDDLRLRNWLRYPPASRKAGSYGSWHLDRSGRGAAIGFGANFAHRNHHIEIGLRDADGSYPEYTDDGELAIRFEEDDLGVMRVHNQPGGPFQVLLSANSSLDSEPLAALSFPAEHGAWHRLVVDTQGQVWLEPRPRAGDGGVVAVTTGEAISVGRLQRIGQVYRDLPYGQSYGQLTSCGILNENEGRCYVFSKGPMTLTVPPWEISSRLTCQPDGRGRFLIFSIQGPRWTIDLLGVPGDACPDSPATLGEGYTVPVKGHGLRAWDADGRLTDIVVTLDGRLYVGDAETSLTCSPCPYEFDDWEIISPPP